MSPALSADRTHARSGPSSASRRSDRRPSSSAASWRRSSRSGPKSCAPRGPSHETATPACRIDVRQGPEMIIDFRVRPPIASFRRLSIYTNTQLKGLFDFHGGTPASAREQSLPMMFREMQQAGVVKAVVWGRTVDDPAESSSNDDVANIVADHPDVFVAGLAGICLRGSGQKVVADAVAEVDRALTQLKLRGITIEPMFGMKPAGSPDQERLYPIYERCEQ